MNLFTGLLNQAVALSIVDVNPWLLGVFAVIALVVGIVLFAVRPTITYVDTEGDYEIHKEKHPFMKKVTLHGACKNGKKLVGWSKVLGNSTAVNKSTMRLVRSVTLYTIWEDVEIDSAICVEFNYMDADEDVAIKKEVFVLNTRLPDVQDDGVEIEGWSFTPDEAPILTKEDVKAVFVVNLYPIFEESPVTTEEPNVNNNAVVDLLFTDGTSSKNLYKESHYLSLGLPQEYEQYDNFLGWGFAQDGDIILDKSGAESIFTIQLYSKGVYVVDTPAQPVVEAPVVVEEPVIEEVIEEPVIEEVIEEPVVEESCEEKTAEEAINEVAEIVEEPIEKPAIEEVAEEVIEEPVIEEPVIEEVIEEPVVEEVIEEPVVEESCEEKTAEEAINEVAEIVEEPIEKPAIEEVVEEVIEEPVIEEPVIEEVIEEPVIEEVVEEPVVEEVIEEPVIEEVVEEPVVEEVIEEPVVEEVIEEPVVEVVEEAPVEAQAIIVPTYFDNEGNKIDINYSRSISANIIQSDDTVKSYYSELKNHILSYKGVKSRISWKFDSYNRGRDQLFKIKLRGKTICLYCNLNPDDFDKSKYHHEAINAKIFADVPMLVKIKSGLGLRKAKELVDIEMAGLGIEKNPKAKEVDYVAQYPYEENEPLIERGLIKILVSDDKLVKKSTKPIVEEVIEEPVAEVIEEPVVEVVEEPVVEEVIEEPVVEVVEEPVVEEVYEEPVVEEVYEEHVVIVEEVSAENADQIAEEQHIDVHVEEGVEYISAKDNKKAIVNVDTLSNAFEPHEIVDLASMKLKGLIDKKAKTVKVLARGSINKPLIVKAGDFSRTAIEMIILTGGNAVHVIYKVK